jgi:predicted dehydrogenase
VKIAVIGLGSMGRRRVRDLVHLGHDVIGVDIRDDRRAEAAADFGIHTLGSHRELPSVIDGVVISTPPDCHAFFYEHCYASQLSFFSEANIFTPPASWFADKEMSGQAKGYPSGTWLFHPLVQRLRDKIAEIGVDQVNTITHRYGAFLPDWHSWEPYHEFYAGRKNSSATREMVPFEVEILVHALGRVGHVSALKRQSREWQNPLDDSFFLILEFESGVTGTMAVELHQITPIRETRVAMRNDTLVLQIGDGKLDHFSRPAGNQTTERPSSYRGRWGFYFEDIYREEIASWISALNGTPYLKTWSDDRHLSDILYAAELSSKTGKRVAIAEIGDAYDGLSWIDGGGLPVDR